MILGFFTMLQAQGITSIMYVITLRLYLKPILETIDQILLMDIILKWKPLNFSLVMIFLGIGQSLDDSIGMLH